MTSLLAKGAKIAPVQDGLPFAITISSGGAGPSTFKLAQPDWKGAAELNLEGLAFANGTLTAKAEVVNKGEVSLQGLRLDVVSATEEYTTKDKDGKDVLATRAQPFTFASPLYFGDLLNSQKEGNIAFAVSGLKLNPETKQVVVRGVLSGMRFERDFDGPGDYGYASIDFAPSGALMGEIYGHEVFTAAAPSFNNPKKFAPVAEQCTGVAVDPTNGDVYATIISSTKIFKFSSAGQAKGELGEANGIDSFVTKLRFDRAGTLYASDGSGIYIIKNGKVQKRIEQVAGVGLGIPTFDVSPDGTIYVTNNNEELLAGGTGGDRKIAGFADWKFGSLMSPFGVRSDRKGLIYIGEEEKEDLDEWDRVTVLDSQGRVVRVFGRGGKVPPVGDEQRLKGQVEGPREIAFGPDGTCYISAGKIKVYKPF